MPRKNKAKVSKKKTHSGLVFMLRRFFYPVLLLVIFIGCEDSNKVEDEIAKIPLELKLVRFDAEFDAAQPENLAELKVKYPYLFPEQYPDSIWHAKINDSLQQVLRAAVRERFSDFGAEEAGLTSLYKHVTYYFKDYKIPTVFTVTNDVAYQDRIMATDSILFISLDNYLWPEHEFFNNVGIEVESCFSLNTVQSRVGFHGVNGASVLFVMLHPLCLSSE